MEDLKYLDPLSTEELARIYNIEHPDQHTSIEMLTFEEFKNKYPELVEKFKNAYPKEYKKYYEK